MRDVGLLDVAVGGRGDVGRPQHRYSLAADAPSLGLEPPTMPVLARMVLSIAKRLDAGAADAEAIGFDEGKLRARRHVDSPSTLEALVGDLDGLGFDPVVTDAADEVGADDDGIDVDDPEMHAVISFANCPFADFAREHPDLVCGLHKGMITGFVDHLGDTAVDEFCTLTSRTPCRVTVSSR